MSRRAAVPDDLASVPVLEGLPPSLIDRLARGAEVCIHGDGALLFIEGATPEHLFVLMRGAVELFFESAEAEPALAIVWPPETLVPAAALTAKPYLMSGRTLGRSAALSLDVARVRRAVAEEPELAARFNRILCGQYRMQQRNLKELRLRDGPQRLAAFLCRLVHSRGAHGCADLPVPKYRLAARLGMAPETVSRALAMLRDNGLEVRGSRVIIRDRERLVGFCGLDPLDDACERDLLATAL